MKISLRRTARIAKPVTEDDLAGYHASVESYDSELGSMWRTLAFGGIAFGVIGVLSAGIAAQSFSRLYPLKETKWQMVYKDQAHGDFAPASDMDKAVESFNDADTAHWLGMYVRAREEWVHPDRTANFNQVTIMSDDLEQKAYAAWFNPPAPTSPFKVYGADGVVREMDRYYSIRQQWKRGYHLGFVEWHWCKHVTDRTGNPTFQPWVSSFNYDWRPGAIPQKITIDGHLVDAKRLNYVGLIVSGYRSNSEGRVSPAPCLGATE